MTKLIFLDVGETLIHDGQTFPGVTDALELIGELVDKDGARMTLGVISDYHLSNPRVEADIVALETRFRDEVLTPAGLTGFFLPFDNRVTLSSRAGVFKPDRRIFEEALRRSGTSADFSDCVFITENEDHLRKCQSFGMVPIHFGPAIAGMASFQAWIDAPSLIARLLTPGELNNAALAIAPVLAARDVVGFSPTSGDGNVIVGHGKQLVQLKDPGLGELDGIFVEQPARVELEFGSDGHLTHVTAAADKEDVSESLTFVRGLLHARKISGQGLKTEGGVTHAVALDPDGRRRLVRQRYSMI